MEKLSELPSGLDCDNCRGSNWVNVRAGGFGAGRCHCPRGRALAAMDADRRKGIRARSQKQKQAAHDGRLAAAGDSK